MLYPFLKTNTLLLSFKAWNITMRVRRPLKGTLRKKIRSYATQSRKVKKTRKPNCFFFFFLFFFFFQFYFIFKLYIIVLVLPNIKMNPPQVYMCSPSRTLLPPPSPHHPSGPSQCTSPKHPVSCIEPGLATRFIYDIILVVSAFQYAI